MASLTAGGTAPPTRRRPRRGRRRELVAGYLFALPFLALNRVELWQLPGS